MYNTLASLVSPIFLFSPTAGVIVSRNRKLEKREGIPIMTSTLEETLAAQIEGAQLPTPVRELKFDPERRWRFDFAWPDLGIACEVQGGVWNAGRHTRAKGYESDCEKLNQAQVAGWVVMQVTGNMIRDGRAIKSIGAAIEDRLRLILDPLGEMEKAGHIKIIREESDIIEGQDIIGIETDEPQTH